MILWYEDLGFYNNPFSIKPAVFRDEVIGQNLKRLFELTESGAVLYVKGNLGTGKTTILKRIIRMFGDDVIVYSANVSEKKIDMLNLLSNSQPWYLRVMGIMPKKRILLVDEAQELNSKEFSIILKFIKKGYLKSVIFFGTVVINKELPKEMKKLLNGNIINLAKLSPEMAVKLVRMRIGSIKFLPDIIIKKLFKKAKNNPRRLLELCEDACKIAVDSGNSKVQEKHIRSFSI